MTRKYVFIAVLLGAIGTMGCKGFETPRDLRKKERPDLPQYSTEEQERRGRARYTIPEDDLRAGPKGLIDRPSPTGR